MIVALVAANRLGHRIARPLQQTEAVTRRIATGDLEARVPVTAQEWPELVSLANSVNQMAASLARAQGTQRQFLMSVSHDLRTPLTSIRGFAEALSDGATTDVTLRRRHHRLLGSPAGAPGHGPAGARQAGVRSVQPALWHARPF